MGLEFEKFTKDVPRNIKGRKPVGVDWSKVEDGVCLLVKDAARVGVLISSFKFFQRGNKEKFGGFTIKQSKQHDGSYLLFFDDQDKHVREKLTKAGYRVNF